MIQRPLIPDYIFYLPLQDNLFLKSWGLDQIETSTLDKQQVLKNK